MSKHITIKLFSTGIPIILLVLIFGCSGTGRNSHINNEHGTLHKNSAKVYINPGETSQVDVLETFGKPDSVIHKHGEVVWHYDKTADVVRNSDVYLTVYFYGAGTSNHSSSSKPVKLIIYFNNNQVVKDYSLQFSELH